MARPGVLARTLAEETVDAVEESRRRTVGFGSEGAVGLRPAIGGAKAARSRRPSAPRSGPASATIAGRVFQRSWHRADPDRRARDLGTFRILPGSVRRARRRTAFWQARAHRAARSELSSAVSDRERAAAEGAARLHNLYRHDPHRRSGPARHAGGRLAA